MNEIRDPDAWRTRSRIPRASGAWVGVARVQTPPPYVADAPRADRPGSDRALTEKAWATESGGADLGGADLGGAESGAAESWAEDACVDEVGVSDHVDARAWAASMLAAEARKADAPRGRHGAPAPQQLPHQRDAAWLDSPAPDAEWAGDAVSGREYSARRTPLSSGDGGRHRAPRALRLVYSADNAEPVEPAERSEGETNEGPVNRPGGHTRASLPAPTEETTPA
ncbi:hypothetical protein [Cryptosporangium aurantiacum]|uniref:hypothetical protein n=1 Tax=Cryptosporangium aurantiacum TaxID=134849 RepID=UPI00116153B2|nr:hypothetical protein [Cryptosporangium aurantiacum]